MIIAIDPGREKCGIAVVNKEGLSILQEVVSSVEICEHIMVLKQKYNIKKIVLGNGTANEEIKKMITKTNLTIDMIDETNSTLKAKKLYWQENPPQGWKKLIPIGLQSPQRPIDDYAALVLARRYLKFT